LLEAQAATIAVYQARRREAEFLGEAAPSKPASNNLSTEAPEEHKASKAAKQGVTATEKLVVDAMVAALKVRSPAFELLLDF